MSQTTAIEPTSFKPGQTITCTVKAEPRAEAAQKTIARLMRRDPENAKSLRHAQELRGKRLNRYIRGNRSWVAREKAAKVVRVETGATWSMPFTPELAADLNSVAGYIDCKAG